MKLNNITISICMLACSCSKTFVETDPQTGQPPLTISPANNSVCEFISIKQINGSVVYNKLNYQRDNLLTPTQLVIFDSITNRSEQNVSFTYKNDTVLINKMEFLILDPVSKNVNKYFYRNYYKDSSYDDQMFTYKYDSYNHLINKYIYLNASSKPDFISNYLYDNDNLVSCQLFMSDGVTKILQSEIQYDITKISNPWLYLFTDFFENPIYMYGFKYGKKSTNFVSNITTRIFDVNKGTLFDTWNTTINGYVISKDNYILQANFNGDLQQGLGVLAGTMRFDYQCK